MSLVSRSTIVNQVIMLSSLSNGHGLQKSVLVVGHHDCPYVLYACHRISNDVLQEYIQDASRLLVDVAAYVLNASSPSKMLDGRIKLLH